MATKGGYRIIYETFKRDIENRIIPTGSFLPTETELAAKYDVSRPTIAKVYNKLQEEGYVRKKIGSGTTVIYNTPKSKMLFGLLLPGAGESEIFSIINDRILELSGEGRFNCQWEGATANNADIRKDLIEGCCDSYIAQKVDGIFFSPLERVSNADKINKRICEKIDRAGIPLVLIDRDIVDFPEKSRFDLVGIDNYNAGFVMGRHLIDSGCDLLYFFYRPNSAYSVQQRISGVCAAARQSKITFGSEHIICAEPNDIARVKSLAVRPGKTGIVCANDSTAALLMSTIDEAGIKVGQDIVICGYDDMKYAEHLKCPLTSYRQPCVDIANVCVELMFRRVYDRHAVPITANLSGVVVVRESSQFSPSPKETAIKMPLIGEAVKMVP